MFGVSLVEGLWEFQLLVKSGWLWESAIELTALLTDKAATGAVSCLCCLSIQVNGFLWTQFPALPHRCRWTLCTIKWLQVEAGVSKCRKGLGAEVKPSRWLGPVKHTPELGYFGSLPLLWFFGLTGNSDTLLDPAVTQFWFELGLKSYFH